jgi:hypothetical protein
MILVSFKYGAGIVDSLMFEITDDIDFPKRIREHFSKEYQRDMSDLQVKILSFSLVKDNIKIE